VSSFEQTTLAGLLRQTLRERHSNVEDAIMVRVTNGGRLLGLDWGDWSMLFSGSALATLLHYYSSDPLIRRNLPPAFGVALADRIGRLDARTRSRSIKPSQSPLRVRLSLAGEVSPWPLFRRKADFHSRSRYVAEVPGAGIRSNACKVLASAINFGHLPLSHAEAHSSGSGGPARRHRCNRRSPIAGICS
jgi:hypothetical protein